MMLIIVGVENGQEEVSNFCSSPGENSYEGLYSLDVTDEHSAADGEVGRRLNQMVPIPVSLLRLYELIEHKVQGDGNCQCMFLQFRALSDQLYQTPEHHEFVRQQVVDQVGFFVLLILVSVSFLRTYHVLISSSLTLRSTRDMFQCHMVTTWKSFRSIFFFLCCCEFSVLQYGVKIFVITSFKDTCYIEILPSVHKSNRVIFLSFWAEVHYNSIYPEGGKYIVFPMSQW
ncbi:hypothetical protein BHE74_00024083 [Ensete ventricosum]|nr:hypothetical protein BHE74_00024083 [Ensete ventricosum]